MFHPLPFRGESAGPVQPVYGPVKDGVGLRRMGQASDERKGQHEETMQAMQTQHEETMRALEVQHEALRELIARTAK